MQQKRHLKIFNILFFFLLLSFPCYSAINVAVSIPPQRFFVKQIAKEKVNVAVFIPPGYNPATYEPNPYKLSQIEKARIYFAIGVPAERVWLKKISSLNRDLIVVHTDEGIKKIDNNPHIWLSPPLVKKQAIIISRWLEKIDPANKGFYERNLREFLKMIDLLDRRIMEILKEKKGKAFIIYHPCLSYFAKRYGLRQIAIEKEGKEPSGSYLIRLISYCKKTGIKAIFVHPEFSQKTAKLIAKETGARLVVIDPLAEDWIRNMEDIAKKIRDFI